MILLDNVELLSIGIIIISTGNVALFINLAQMEFRLVKKYLYCCAFLNQKIV